MDRNDRQRGAINRFQMIQAYSKYKVHDLVRLQLSPDATKLRWQWSDITNDWTDLGEGKWTDAIIVATTFEPEGYVGWGQDPIAILNWDDDNGNLVRGDIPLESHPAYPKTKLIGFPMPSKDNKLPKCDCGSDTIYGKKNKLHQHYCSKGHMLKLLGII